MNILIISTASGYGGSERTIEIICKGLIQKHHVVVFAENEIHCRNLKNNKIMVKTASRGNSIFATINNIQNIIKLANESDVIITNTNKPAFLIAISSIFSQNIKSKRKLIFVRDFQWRYKKIIKRLLDNHIFCVASKAVESYVNKNFDKKVYIIPNPIDDVSIDKLTTNEAFDIKEKFILCPAMISRWKGIHHILYAMYKSNILVKLYVVGDVVDLQYYEELKQIVHRLGLSERVVFKGYTKNIQNYYRKCEFVISSSISRFGGPETFGRVIIESWQNEKTVIAFDCGGPSYLIDNEYNGILVEEGNDRELGDKINELLENEDKCKKMGYVGYLKVKAEFSVNNIANEIIKLSSMRVDF